MRMPHRICAVLLLAAHMALAHDDDGEPDNNFFRPVLYIAGVLSLLFIATALCWIWCPWSFYEQVAPYNPDDKVLEVRISPNNRLPP